MAEALLSTGFRFDKLPENYIRPESERPRLSEVVSLEVPLIDLDSSINRDEIVSRIGNACRDFGIFQVTNHGISTEAIQKVFAVTKEFFQLPVEEKMRYYSNDPSKNVRLATSRYFNVENEKVHNWRDFLRFYSNPLEEFVNDWPTDPHSFKDVMGKYSREARELGFKLLGAISESLGLETDYIERVLGKVSQHMTMNYYPACPEPDLTFGFPAHTDKSALTILLPDDKVAGLQMLKDGKWSFVDSHPNSLLVNLGDQIQVLSNERYKSVWHRVTVNSNQERISVGSFLLPANDAVIAPAKELISEESPAMYNSFIYEDYDNKILSGSVDDEKCLELFK